MEREYTTIIAGNEYKLVVSLVEDVYCYDFLRNGKVQSSTTAPKENRDDIKMWISEKLLQMAIYDINHFVGKIELTPHT